MGLKNSKYFELIKQNIKTFKLDLSEYSILLSPSPKETALMAVIAAMAGAKNVYVKTDKPLISDNIKKEAEEFGFNNIKCINNLTDEVLFGVNIVVKGGEIDNIDRNFLNRLNNKCVITLFPENLDFGDTEGIDMSQNIKESPYVVGLDPEDQNLNLYDYYSHIILKRCYEAGLDVYKSKLLLIGHGNLLNTSLQLLKSAGAVVYSCNVKKSQDGSHLLKYMPELDAIIAMDYPCTSQQLVGSKGIISISDIVDLCPNVKVIHFSGKLEEASLNFGKLRCYPAKITQNSINLNIRELGEKGLVEMATASLKVADNFIKSVIHALQLNDSIVIYKRLNKSHPVLLGRDH